MIKRKVEIRWITSDGSDWIRENDAQAHQNILDLAARGGDARFVALENYIRPLGFFDPVYVTNQLAAHWNDLCALVRQFDRASQDETPEITAPPSAGGNYTPGPWRITKAMAAVAVRGECGQHVAYLCKVSDAPLIAAAPDMLEMLKDILYGAENHGSPWSKTGIKHIRNIIAKAEGRV